MPAKVIETKIYHGDMNASGSMRVVELRIEVQGQRNLTDGQIVDKVAEAVAKSEL